MIIENYQSNNCILFCGDTFLKTKNGEAPFTGIIKYFENNVVCLNLETGLRGNFRKEKNVVLLIDDMSLQWLSDEINILSIVNNHCADSGDPKRLARVLGDRGKIVIGPDNPSVANTTIGDISVDFLSAYFAIPRLRMSYDGVRADVLENMLHNSDADRRIVNLHWGYEHTDVPAPFQRKLAKRLIDAGADLIIGHHPHVPQGFETYKSKFIFYSLGNFNFWQFDKETTYDNRWGYMVMYGLINGDIELIPYIINENFQPVPVSHEESQELISRVNILSERIHTTDDVHWFATDYAYWYKREFKVWSRHCLKCSSLSLWLKYLAWLLLPMNLRYYFHTVRFKILKIGKKKKTMAVDP
ncbi:MAG TPA: CapA family protein [Desulfomonilia bacterium]